MASVHRMLRARALGFTTVELLAGLTIIAVLGSIAVPAYRRYRLRSKTTEALFSLRRIYDGSMAAFYASQTEDIVGMPSASFPPPIGVTPSNSCCSGGGGGPTVPPPSMGDPPPPPQGEQTDGGSPPPPGVDAGSPPPPPGVDAGDHNKGHGNEPGTPGCDEENPGQGKGSPCRRLQGGGGKDKGAWLDDWSSPVSLAMAALPLSALAAEAPTGGGGRCEVSASDWNHPTWNRIGFAMKEPHYYRYAYCSTGRGAQASFAAVAYGDLDCDGVESTYERVGGAIGFALSGPSGNGGVFIEQDLE